MERNAINSRKEMKAEITYGEIRISPENIIESYALDKWAAEINEKGFKICLETDGYPQTTIKVNQD